MNGTDVPAGDERAGGGPARFTRYAYPPNELGYCGPGDPGELLGLAATGEERGLAALARRFEGAWPYLEVIAAANGIADPLDERVVEAYWVGNSLLHGVRTSVLLASVRERFGRRAGRDLDALSAAVPLGALAHHSFHVFGVYPWLGLLRAGGHAGDGGAAMTVLDRCRIRWGTVLGVDGDLLTVSSRGLAFDGHSLHAGTTRVEVVRRGLDGSAMLRDAEPGDVVSMHWDWACERLSEGALRRLQRYTARTLAAVNGAPVPGPAAVLDRLGA